MSDAGLVQRSRRFKLTAYAPCSRGAILFAKPFRIKLNAYEYVSDVKPLSISRLMCVCANTHRHSHVGVNSPVIAESFRGPMSPMCGRGLQFHASHPRTGAVGQEYSNLYGY